MKRLAISLVLYNNDPAEVDRLLLSIRRSSLSADLFIVDNSSENHASQFDGLPHVRYCHTGKNLGYGAGHNLILRQTVASYSYHLVVNPDIYFEEHVLKRLVEHMDAHPQIGHMMPKILYPNGETQYLCKNLPRPWHLIARRILPGHWAERWNHSYEMRYADYDQPMEVPFLSGCFMLLRTSALRKIGFFDERYFLYFEDLDLTRRIARQYGCLYWPEVAVVHNHKNENYRNLALLRHLIQSGIRYFNRYGWRPFW